MDTIIFDVDDTLYDQLTPFKNAFENSFKQFQDVPMEKLYVSSRKHSESLFHKSEAGEIPLIELHTYRIMAACQDFGLTIGYEEAVVFQKIYEQEQKRITLHPEIKTLLEHLTRRKKKLGILTNGPYLHQLKKIEQLGLSNWIPEDNIFISENIGIAKPDPKAFIIMEERLNLVKETTVYIGDSFENDVVGAKQVGWNCIWMNHRRKGVPDTLFTPDKVIYEPAELLEFIGEYF